MSSAIVAKQASASRAWLRALEFTARIERHPKRIFPQVIEELGARRGAAPALIGASESFSHAALAARARRYANWSQAQGIAKGQVVALMLGNRPDYLAIWLGITRTGGVVALINIHLRGELLDHGLKSAAPSHIIVAAELEHALDGLATAARVWRDDTAFAAQIEGFPDAPPDTAPAVTLDDPALLIYTSGTTGLPKAAYVSHRRIMLWTHWFAGLMGAEEDDRLYNCLPMYHSIGGVAAPGAVLVAGGAVIIREKFSARIFWADIAASGATIFQYIGELCRYLLTAPPIAGNRNKLRLACGNGLSGEVWTSFQQRFAIPQIVEFYAATEGNFSLYNAEGKPGAIGRIPAFLAHRFPTALVRLDHQTGLPMRGADGFCIKVARGEAGEAIGEVAGGAARFEGYTDRAAGENKILRDAFKPGDAWLRSGDLMRQDGQGFFYFVDRIGDTFRWKGENVATAEVAAILSAAPHVAAAAVYGVTVPGTDGRAGMAALEVTDGFDLAGFRAHAAARLPAYARPVFLRLMPSLAMTETFKHKKAALVEDGFNPDTIGDRLFADTGEGYVTLDRALYARLISGLNRL